jgi:hypothetical protein
MNKKFLIAWVVVFVLWMMGSYAVHGGLLENDYSQLPNLMRTEAEAQARFPLMLLAHLIMAGAFVWIYSRGAEAKPWLAQGIRFGIAVALLGIVPTYMIYYVVQPFPGDLVVKQIVFEGLLIVILGAVVAFFYRQPSA